MCAYTHLHGGISIRIFSRSIIIRRLPRLHFQNSSPNHSLPGAQDQLMILNRSIIASSSIMIEKRANATCTLIHD
jgi:hypothetical protein